MPRIDDYKAARALAVAELKKINPKRLAGLSRCEYFYEDDHDGLIVLFFGQERLVIWPEVSVTPGDGRGELPLTEQILILHYLMNTTGEPLSGRDIDFRQVPEGGFYWSAFVSRAKKPLLETFGHDLDLYLEVAGALGGTPGTLGDASATFMAFPLVPVTHVLWRGDEEFPPDANILFDETIPRHLSTEDIAALAGSSVYRLMGAAHKMRKSH
ncbi:MAG: hypothetical protein A2Z73_01050 [Deltaproteobacteria bacterium RBG_13_60_28]|nr:MAG: hypothetical protein A2Z73_01050 [Deltaproteobacteria bacterium RBG_13_60_28]